MKKQSRSWLAGMLMLALVLALGCFSAYGKGLEGEAYANPIRHKVERIERGAELHYYEFADLFGHPQTITVVYLDWKRDWHISLAFCGDRYRTVTEMAEAAGADIAINGTFFVMKAEKPRAAGEFRIDGNRLFKVNPNWQGYLGFDQSRDFPVITADDPGTRNVMQADPMLVVNGEVTTEFVRRQGPHPRTAMGLTADSKVVLVVVDGRHEGRAFGVTLPELAQLCLALGCRDAFNLDGGGSSTLFIRGRGVVNYPCDNRKFDHAGSRRVDDAILFTYGKEAAPSPMPAEEPAPAPAPAPAAAPAAK